VTGSKLLAEVDQRLARFYGNPPQVDCRDPLDVLIRTILSQNTSDLNRDRAYAALRSRFPRWEDLLSAPVEEVENAIKGAGLYRQRARRIKEVLARIAAKRGELTLDFLGKLPPEQAEKWLLSLPGVWKKTAYIVLLFCFGRRRFPVDTHIKRVTGRLGLVPPGKEPHAALAPLVPPGREIPLHLNLIRLGREICRPRLPRCELCPLADLCRYPAAKLDPRLRKFLASGGGGQVTVIYRENRAATPRTAAVDRAGLLALVARPEITKIEASTPLEAKEAE